jgi:ATP-dependent RNA helicase SUPV3L1/SUV3
VANGSDILVANDVVGMGLNLNIRRIIFSTLENFDGTSMRALTMAEIKQIAGQRQYLYSYFKMPVALVVFGLVAMASSTLE